MGACVFLPASLAIVELKSFSNSYGMASAVTRARLATTLAVADACKEGNNSQAMGDTEGPLGPLEEQQGIIRPCRAVCAEGSPRAPHRACNRRS